MADKGKNCSLWLNFFRDAGITGGFETKYALIFDENRIKMNMMLDLNKECLRDMGIKAMGDIIAILKHAKIVHDESMEQAFQTSKAGQSQSQSQPQPPAINIRREVQTVTASTSPPKSTPVAAPATSSKVTTSQEFTVAKPPEVTATATSTSQHVFRIPAVPKPKEVKKSPVPNSTSTKKIPWILGGGSSTLPRKRVIQLRTASDSEPQHLQEEVPVQKKIRVFPEHEGKYKIKMPSGSVVRGRTLENRLGPSKSDTVAEKKAGIFNRLGESKVTSTSTIEQTVTRNIKPISFSDDEESSSSKSSVFARLGGRAGTASTSTSTAKPTTLRLISSTSYSKLNDREDRDRQRDGIEIRRKISTTASRESRSLSTNSEGMSRITKVFRNPLNLDDRSPPKYRAVQSTSTSRMRSEIADLGRSNSIKSRLEIRRPSSTSSRSTRVSPSLAKKINTPTVRTTKPEEPPRKVKPQSKPEAIGNSSARKTTFTRIITRRPEFEDPIDIIDLDLPELDDPMAPYYELEDD